jgi:hypothetical protein
LLQRFPFKHQRLKKNFTIVEKEGKSRVSIVPFELLLAGAFVVFTTLFPFHWSIFEAESLVFSPMLRM